MLASTFRDPVLRDEMLKIAADYERLAENAEAISPLQNIKVNKLVET